MDDNDRAIIGAYYGDGQFGLNGNSRPIIDGDGNPAQYLAVIDENNTSKSYITIQNLRINDSGGYGIRIGNADNVNIDNCYIHQPAFNCIVYGSANGGVDTGTISNNTCDTPDYHGGGAGIEVTSSNNEGWSEEITIEYNTMIVGCLEGIGLYKRVTDSVVRYNVVYDAKTAGIYIDAGKRNVIYNNLVYQTTSYPYDGAWSGIIVDNEKWWTCFSGDNRIYGNLVAGVTGAGIALGCWEAKEDSSCYCHDGTKVYNNTLVDNTYNFRIWDPDSRESVEIKNNISYTISDSSNHSDSYSPAGFTWSHNNFDEAVSGNAATNAVIGDAALKKSSGWRSLTANSLDGTEFSILAGSKSQNAGISIASCNDRIGASNFAGDPITVTTSTDSTPDIGAWMTRQAGKPSLLDPPNGFRIANQ